MNTSAIKPVISFAGTKKRHNLFTEHRPYVRQKSIELKPGDKGKYYVVCENRPFLARLKAGALVLTQVGLYGFSGVGCLTVGSILSNLVLKKDLPKIRLLEETQPALMKKLDKNSTQSLPKNPSDEELWKGMQDSLEILHAINPEVADFYKNEYKKGNVVFADFGNRPKVSDIKTENSEYKLNAGYHIYKGKFLIGREFFTLNNNQKVKILSHEYSHWNDTWGDRVFSYFTNFGQDFSEREYLFVRPIEQKAYRYGFATSFALKSLKPHDFSPFAEAAMEHIEFNPEKIRVPLPKKDKPEQ